MKNTFTKMMALTAAAALMTGTLAVNAFAGYGWESGQSSWESRSSAYSSKSDSATDEERASWYSSNGVGVADEKTVEEGQEDYGFYTGWQRSVGRIGVYDELPEDATKEEIEAWYASHEVGGGWDDSGSYSSGSFSYGQGQSSYAEYHSNWE